MNNDLISDSQPTEAMYIAGQICADSATFDDSALRRIANIVDPTNAKLDDVVKMNRDALCRWLRKRSPWTWTSHHVTSAMTGFASKMQLTAKSILKSIQLRLNQLVHSSRLLRAVYNSTSFENFKERLEAPPNHAAQKLRDAAKALRNMLQELHALQQAENRFSAFPGAAWFGRLTSEDHTKSNVLTKTITRLLNMVEQYAVKESSISEGSSGETMTHMREKIKMLAARLDRIETALRWAKIS